MICLKKGGEFEEDGPLCLGGKRHSSATLGSFFSLCLFLFSKFSLIFSFSHFPCFIYSLLIIIHSLNLLICLWRNHFDLSFSIYYCHVEI